MQNDELEKMRIIRLSLEKQEHIVTTIQKTLAEIEENRRRLERLMVSIEGLIMDGVRLSNK